jgi:CheY-like chemotaxis protein/HPt (histidine-containing phosphotransfer) domain-containing protein
VKEEEQLIKSSILTSHPINSVKAEGEKTIKILLVDDVDTNLIMIKSLFEKYFDASCDLVADGVEAVKRVRENNYNIVLIDIKMPIMDGVSAAREIRKFNKEIPMITYSTSITDVKKEEIKEAGFNDFLPWPLRHNILLRTIAKWLMIKNYWFEDRQPTEERIAESFRDKNLLLVDDQDLNRVLVASHLVKNYDILVDQASNGKEAVEKFIAKAKSGDPYDLVFMDVKMPIMDGFEATKQIRKYQEENKAQQNVPIVAITGDGDRDSVNKIFASGMDDYFIKGDNYDNITKIIMLWTHIIGENNIYNEKISIAKESLQSGIINKSYGDLLPQIIPIFIKDGQALIDDMKKAKEENDINKLSFSAHALKGVCGNMKAERLYKLCSYISDLAKQNKWPSDSDWMNEVEKAFVDTKEELKKYQA